MNEILDTLTDIEVETSSHVIFALCERIRDMEDLESETWIIYSFITWATAISRKLDEEIEIKNRETNERDLI